MHTQKRKWIWRSDSQSLVQKTISLSAWKPWLHSNNFRLCFRTSAIKTPLLLLVREMQPEAKWLPPYLWKLDAAATTFKWLDSSVSTSFYLPINVKRSDSTCWALVRLEKASFSFNGRYKALLKRGKEPPRHREKFQQWVALPLPKIRQMFTMQTRKT